jgi:hypothetical protein
MNDKEMYEIFKKTFLKYEPKTIKMFVKALIEYKSMDGDVTQSTFDFMTTTNISDVMRYSLDKKNPKEELTFIEFLAMSVFNVRHGGLFAKVITAYMPINYPEYLDRYQQLKYAEDTESAKKYKDRWGSYPEDDIERARVNREDLCDS